MESLKNNLQTFVEYIEDLEMDDCRGYLEDFKELKLYSAEIKLDDRIFPSGCGKLEENQIKNRFRDIIPFDSNRVVLKPSRNQSNNDYINASCIRGVSEDMSYIATQGPLPNTVCDFWRMIWQYSANIVIMAGKEVEFVDGKPKKKCERYWPEGDEIMIHDDIHVKLKNIEWPSQHYAVRTISVRQADTVRELIQFHFVSWPDKKAPDSLVTLVDMLAQVWSKRIPGVPIIVHCSAGCGRTGTIISIDYSLNLLKNRMIDEDFSLYDLIKSLRQQRPAMVQTLEQYILVHRTVRAMFKNELEKMNDCDWTYSLSKHTVTDEDPYMNIDFKNIDMQKLSFGMAQSAVDSSADTMTHVTAPPKPPRHSDGAASSREQTPDVLRVVNLFESDLRSGSLSSDRSIKESDEKFSKRKPSSTSGCNIFSSCTQPTDQEIVKVQAIKPTISGPFVHKIDEEKVCEKPRVPTKPTRLGDQDKDVHIVDKPGDKPLPPLKPKIITDGESDSQASSQSIKSTKTKGLTSMKNDNENRISMKSLGEIIGQNLNSNLQKSGPTTGPILNFNQEIAEKSKGLNKNVSDMVEKLSKSSKKADHTPPILPPPPSTFVANPRLNLPPPPPPPPPQTPSQIKANSLEKVNKSDFSKTNAKSQTLGLKRGSSPKKQSNSLGRQNRALEASIEKQIVTVNRKLSNPIEKPSKQQVQRLLSHPDPLGYVHKSDSHPPPLVGLQSADHTYAAVNREPAKPSQDLGSNPYEVVGFKKPLLKTAQSTFDNSVRYFDVDAKPFGAGNGLFETKNDDKDQENEDANQYFEVKTVSEDRKKLRVDRKLTSTKEERAADQEDSSVYSRERFPGPHSPPAVVVNGESIYSAVITVGLLDQGEPDRAAFGVMIGYPNRLGERPSGGRPCPDHSMVNWLS